MSYDHKNTNQIVKAMGRHRIVLADPETGKQTETPLTLAELIHYIQTSGACVSSPFNESELEDM